MSRHHPKSSRDGREKPKYSEKAGYIFDINQELLSDSSSSFRKEYTVLFIIGTEFFHLLKLILKKPIVAITIGDLINLTDNRSFFLRIKRIGINKIPKGTEDILQEMISTIISDQEKHKFVPFFNQAKPISVKLHQLKLLPGVGQKRMWTIIEKRKEKEFSSFEDIEMRTGLNPVPALKNRIIEELEGKEQHYLFVK